jgi:hypothetical protein
MYVYIYNMYNWIRSTVDSLQWRRNGITPSVNAFTRIHGQENITQFTISRTVLNPLLTGAIGVISPSFRRETQDTKLCHLHVLIRTSKTSFSLEKNSRITIGHCQKRNCSEDMPVSISPGLTLNILLDRTRANMDGRFLPYSAKDNNWNHFILAILRANNLSTPVNTLFVEQTTDHLFTPQLRKITNTITNIAGGVRLFREVRFSRIVIIEYSGSYSNSHYRIRITYLIGRTDYSVWILRCLGFESEPMCSRAYRKK